ncbi:RNA methyltransferase [Nanoarchaeota archaeon]
MISIILIEPENSGNLGAIARVMKNFGFKDLILINPQCKVGEDTKCRAKHAQDILKKIKTWKSFDSLKRKFDYLVGTTAILGTDYNIPRTPITPEMFAKKLLSLKPSSRKKVALIIGREGQGLYNSELEQCDFIVTIPTHKKYPTLNISHSVGILLYEINKVLGKDKIGENIIPADQKEKQIFLKQLNKTLDKFEFDTDVQKKTQKLVWKRMIGRTMLTKRELYALFGFLRKIKK